MRLNDGSIVISHDSSGGESGTFLNDEDRYRPAKTWLDEEHCVIGGLLPPGAVNAEVVDDRGTRVGATVALGAYVAVLDQPNDGHDPIVCCRDRTGHPVRRPWAGDYPSVRVTDAEEPCPACGAIDYDEYSPYEEWRGGRGRGDGTIVPNPVVSCRVCGHDEAEGTFQRFSGKVLDGEDETRRQARIAYVRLQQRKRQWNSTEATLRETRFPIYAAHGWPAQMGGSGSHGGQCREITIYHYDNPDPDPYAGDRPRILITTRRDDRPFLGTLFEARRALESRIRADSGSTQWPNASDAAITLWLRARDRERRAAVLDAKRSEQVITTDGAPVAALMLSTPAKQWVAVAHHSDLTIIVAAHDIDVASLRLRPITDPIAQLLGPEPTEP